LAINREQKAMAHDVAKCFHHRSSSSYGAPTSERWLHPQREVTSSCLTS
jgi:hypothetical protein